MPGALALPFPGCRAIPGAGSRLQLLLTPGLPNVPSPVSSTSCVYLAAKSPRGGRKRRKRRKGSLFPFLYSLESFVMDSTPDSPAPFCLLPQ